MKLRKPSFRMALTTLLTALAPFFLGCASTNKAQIPSISQMPKELSKVSLPEYVIEPPDVLQIDLLISIPKPPYKIKSLDALFVRVPEALPEAPLGGVFQVEPDGTLNLGPIYGTVPVAGLTIPEARNALEMQLLKVIKKATIDLSLSQGRAVQQVRGAHLVRQDGTIGLGSFGAVRVVGLTLPQAKHAIEIYLSKYFQDPEISLDVTGFNSKIYYVIFDGGSSGQQISRMPITGNETVLDAVGQLGGLTTIADSRKMWISRPAPADSCPAQVLPIDWKAITECADTRTNYQVLPGDRIFVKAYPLVEFDLRMGRVLAPFERILGVSLLGVSTAQAFNNNNNQNFINGR